MGNKRDSRQRMIGWFKKKGVRKDYDPRKEGTRRKDKKRDAS